MTRRTVSALLLGSGALQPQAPPKEAAAQKPAAGEDLREAAVKQVQSTSDSLRKYRVPMETEPAFQFKA